jgi:hypothetical protein
MEFANNSSIDVIGLTELMCDSSANINIKNIENEILNGIDIDDENYIPDQFQREIDAVNKNFNVDDFLPPEKNEPSGSIPDIKWSLQTPEDSQLRYMTQEEKKQTYISEVLEDLDEDANINMDQEREDDERNSLLEQIDMLRITLEEDSVDISNVPNVTKKNSMSDIQNVYKILRLKNDRNRYCSFANELILSGAYGLEHLFDGKKEWFGRRPDLVGWSSTVRVKLRRMRYETSTFVQDIMQEYNMSSGTRLFLELIPSMFLYSRSRRMSQNDNLVSDSQYKDALNELGNL